MLLPHRLFNRGDALHYNHLAHEMVRLYGCLSLGLGWLVYWAADINDGRLVRRVSESFAAAYTIQALVMARAQFTNPQGHRFLHWLLAILCLAIGTLYISVRVFTKIKDFELPRGF